MKNVLLTLSAALVFAAVSAEAQQWRELKGDHFIIYYVQDETFARNVLSKAEDYYDDIAEELGYQRYSSFWTWENRAKIYIYADKDSFLKASGQQEWSEGLADYRTRSIISYAWHENFTEALLPHEITHLIFRDYVGFEGEISVWLDEGVAQWMEPWKREAVKDAIRNLMSANKLLSVPEMLSLDPRATPDADKVLTFYIRAVSVVGFLITKYGGGNFIGFCRQLRDGKSLEEALRFSYPTSIRSVQELEDRWREYIQTGR